MQFVFPCYLNKIFEAPVVQNDGDLLSERVFDDERGRRLLVLLGQFADLGEGLRQGVQHAQEGFGHGQLENIARLKRQ